MMSVSSATSSIRSLSPDDRFRRRNAVSASNNKIARKAAFVSAVLSALCAGSVTVFSLYGHIFQERLHYSQFQVNGVAIAASIACYLPVPLMGYVCDRAGPAPLSLLAGILFGLGYGLAALIYRQAASEAAAHAPGSLLGPAGDDASWTYALMVAAFVIIGTATCGMYLSAVATCAKNFGRGRHRGLALAMPIAAYGLSGMWQSQLASRVLYERLPPLQPGGPVQRGDVDVFVFFLFLAVLLTIVGLLGAFTLRIIDEDELIDEAVDELERSGLLDSSVLFSPSTPTAPSAPSVSSPPSASAPSSSHNNRVTHFGPGVSGRSGKGYGTMARSDPYSHRTDDDEDDALANCLLDPSKDADEAGESDQERAHLKKQWVLNAETRRFLTDHTMWLFALGFFFMIGPGEAFINNMGTIIKTLGGAPTTAATHVSIVGLVSTVVRLLTGTLTDLLAPRPQTQYLQGGRDGFGADISPSSSRPMSAATSSSSLLSGEAENNALIAGRLAPGSSFSQRPSISRVAFLLTFALVMSTGFVVLASGSMQGHGERFWLVSALVGAGYGAVFSLTPIIITVIWGVENFATNWGIVAMFPALGATLWGLVYSAVYQTGASRSAPEDGAAGLCYGTQCYASTFWAMSVSVWLACGLVLFAWKGRRGWSQREIVI
ncbi:major facilitator superfamily transporter monocarboxylic acid [Grosmannia clavigera kw1407]|uniref:Probable transporter MCH1 n=1 Tax=Grosmannia clavigera (strain kw1407 / UAMH 11150) TaxID=655863 RepID=F0X709_GROCL|nr:major facilitator superfamily transporter monocarboxylic acid [Grosmannia clavigera kw1407]EFX06627.1 major facilitator superfamily transporter monocarboxylic acid [Grosmannia clavigera kw1407]